jgi:hypothetical protein
VNAADHIENVAMLAHIAAQTPRPMPTTPIDAGCAKFVMEPSVAKNTGAAGV